MKALMTFGSVVGFVMATVCGMANGSSWPNILWRASVAALAAALLTRWWGRVWFMGLTDAIQQPRDLRGSNSETKSTTAKL
jgi:hypothetical protein